jgi:hypothetical protein
MRMMWFFEHDEDAAILLVESGETTKLILKRDLGLFMAMNAKRETSRKRSGSYYCSCLHDNIIIKPSR